MSTANRKSGKQKNAEKPKGTSARSGSSASQKQTKKNLPAAEDTRVTRKQAPNAAPDDSGLLSASMRKDIAGIFVALIAIVLFVCAVMPVNGVVSSAISNVLHLCLGLGAYILPIFLVGFAVTFFFRHEDDTLIARVALGLALIFIALLGILALLTPGSEQEKIDALFNASYLVALGGYVGAGLTWCWLTLFGTIIAAIIHIATIVVGFVIIGFSISHLIEVIQDKRAARTLDRVDEGGLSAPPFARVRVSPDAAARQAAFEAAETMQLDSVSSDSAVNDEPSCDGDSQRTSSVMDVQAPTRKLSDDAARNGMAADGMSSAAIPGTGKAASASGSKKGTRTKKAAEDASAQPMATEGFELPDLGILDVSPRVRKGSVKDETLNETAAALQRTLEQFGIMATVVGWVAGPTVTLFKVELPAGVRVNKVTVLHDDIALALAAPGVRIFAPIPGTNYVGIEVPNRVRQSVLLGDVLPSAGKGPLQVAIGKDVEGNCIVSDLAKMPHLLIGGTTGSGKSVCINSMIMSILMRATPDEVRMILIDPKRVEFTPYNDIPHLYVPVVTEPKEAASALSWGVAEMERRLKLFSKVGARNIGQYNAKVQSGALESGEAIELPYIVIVIDELADLMMNVGKEVEFSISRIAQLARAAGIHLIVATQRPSANVVTGLIKANITNRIAFNVASSIDSRVILDTPGAESLIGLGDLLLSKPELSKPQRIQGCFVTEEEIFEVVEFLKEQKTPEYHSEILTTNLITLGSSMPDGSGGSGSDEDPLVWEAAEMVVSSGLGSTSNIQRRFKVGYSRAGRIMDLLEEKGIVGPANGSRPREVLLDSLELETLKAFEMSDEKRD